VGKISVYWNNICLLRRAEEKFVGEYAKNNADFCVKYFGLGMPKKLRNQIADDLQKYGEPKADVIVSTDLDIFQDKRLLLGKFDFFADIAGQFVTRDEIKATGTEYPVGQVVTAHVLPMVICVNEDIAQDIAYPETLKDLCKNEYKGKIVLGGNDTAAGRSIAMSIWYLYGEKCAMKFLQNAIFVSIPAMAYNACAKKKEFPVCILPSVLAKQGGLKTVFPKDGAPAIPTYVCVRRGTPAEALGFLKSVLFGIEMQRFYSDRAVILPSHPDVKINPALFDNGAMCRFLYPDYDFVQSFDMLKFCEIMDGIKLGSVQRS